MNSYFILVASPAIRGYSGELASFLSIPGKGTLVPGIECMDMHI
jgi:hypothetical protein